MSGRYFGRSLDRIEAKLPPGRAREFVRRLPRQMTLEEARAAALAVVTLVESGEGRS
jgi:hypothetical protein